MVRESRGPQWSPIEFGVCTIGPTHIKIRTHKTVKPEGPTELRAHTSLGARARSSPSSFFLGPTNPQHTKLTASTLGPTPLRGSHFCNLLACHHIHGARELHGPMRLRPNKVTPTPPMGSSDPLIFYPFGVGGPAKPTTSSNNEVRAPTPPSTSHVRFVRPKPPLVYFPLYK